MIFSIKNISVMCVIAILLIALLVKSCENNQLRNHVEKIRIPDTVFVKKPYKVIEIKKEYIEKPVKVFVYLKDTTLRKEAERSDIVLGVDIKRKNIFSNEDIIKVDKITPLGLVMSSEYPLPTFREIKIDEHGNLEVKKKRFPKLRKVLRIVLIGAAGFIIGKEVSTIK